MRCLIYVDSRILLRNFMISLGVMIACVGCMSDRQNVNASNNGVQAENPMSVSEMIESIKLLASPIDIAGDCMSIEGDSTEDLRAYFVLAQKASEMPHSDLMEVNRVFRRLESSTLYDNIAKLHLINRLIYEVPISWQYDSYEATEDMYSIDSKVVFWRITPTVGSEVNYLFPFVYDDSGDIWLDREFYRDESGVYNGRSDEELEHFAANFDRRNLSVYLMGQN